MKQVFLLMHVSLDGFVAGPNGEMDFISFDDAQFDFVGTLTDNADTALYGRKTWEMMEGYWPTADQQPNATKHDKNHAAWYRKSLKLVISNSLQTAPQNTKIISGDIVKKMNDEKQQSGGNILMIGSPSTAHLFTNAGLIDHYWLFVNPVILGTGIPLFKDVPNRHQLRLVETKPFATGVVGLHYEKA
jgi:dihydrofolate reductase